MGKITDDELAMLSPEEREALDGDTENKSTDEIKAEEEADAACPAYCRRDAPAPAGGVPVPHSLAGSRRCP